MEILQTLWEMVRANYQEYLIVGAIMVSAVIVFIGILKIALFNRIQCKLVRKVLLAFSNILFSFGATAIYFVIEHFTWQYYVHASIVVSVACILTYWLYENTCLRDLIDKIGSLTIKKFFNVALMWFNKSEKDEIEAEVKKVTKELKAATEKELKKAKKSVKFDKELANL